MIMTLKQAKQVVGEILKTENMDLMTSVFDFCADSGHTVHELLTDKQVKKALELKMLFPTQKTTETKDLPDLERTLLYRSQLAEKAKTNMENMNKVDNLLANLTTTEVPPVLFRITWDKGKKGMDVIGKMPIISKESPMLIVVMLQYSKEFKTLLQLNNVDALHADYIRCYEGKYQIHTNGGEWIPAEISNILEEKELVKAEVEKATIKKPKVNKPKAEKPVVIDETKKEENEEEGEKKGE